MLCSEFGPDNPRWTLSLRRRGAAAVVIAERRDGGPAVVAEGLGTARQRWPAARLHDEGVKVGGVGRTVDDDAAGTDYWTVRSGLDVAGARSNMP